MIALEELWPDEKNDPGGKNMVAGLFGKLAAEVAVVVAVTPLAG